MDVRDELALDGRTAVVTGGAGLLGREFASALAGVGADVVLIDVDEHAAREVATAIERDGGRPVRVLAIDIGDERAVDSAIASLERVDALVNSAAIDPKVAPGRALAGRLATYDLDAWEASLRVNLTGTFLVTRACVRTMEGQGPRGRGAIVNVSSTYGLVGPDQRLYEEDGQQAFVKPVDYSVTKAGILGFTRAVAAMYAGTDIRVNALTPGGAFAGQDDGFVERYSARTVLGRMADPGDYGAAVVFLCSDAARYMTGANLVIDGGWTAW